MKITAIIKLSGYSGNLVICRKVFVSRRGISVRDMYFEMFWLVTFIWNTSDRVPEKYCGALINELITTLKDKHVNYYINNVSMKGFKPIVYAENLDSAAKTKKVRFVEGVWIPEAGDIKLLAIRDHINSNKYFFVVLESDNLK